MKFKRITVNPKQMDGVPCIRGLRIPVATVVGMVADIMRFELDENVDERLAALLFGNDTTKRLEVRIP